MNIKIINRDCEKRREGRKEREREKERERGGRESVGRS